MCVTVVGDLVEYEEDGGAVRVRILQRGNCVVEVVFPTRAKFVNAFAGASTLLEGFDKPDNSNILEYAPKRAHAETA